MNSIQLNITGMKCGGCVNTVENILKNSDGVEMFLLTYLLKVPILKLTKQFQTLIRF